MHAQPNHDQPVEQPAREPYPDGHANFVYLPGVERPWQEVFGDTGLKARYYPDGAARITVGSRSSTQAVLAAVSNWRTDRPGVVPVRDL